MSTNPEIMLVMPAYNEQASVRKVVLEWFDEVENWTENFVFLAIDDGSQDDTLKILTRLQQTLGPRLEVISRENRGHAQSCLQGYRIACERSIPFLFQLDSDGQCDPQYFFRFWRDRNRYDVIYGNRVQRDDGWRRILASKVLRMSLVVWCGVNCVDANVPYRLMRTEAICDLLPEIQSNFHLANVALAVLLKRKRVRHGSIPIHFRERYGGEPSVPLSNFSDKALELKQQLKMLMRQNKGQ